jgi:uncharacterized protein (TIGR00369 family)
MDLLKQFAHIISEIPFNRTIGLKLSSVESDHVAMSFSNSAILIGNYLHGILHGGVISSVLDMAGGAAVMAAVIMKHPNHSVEDLGNMLGKSSTVNLHIDFLRPGKGQHFIAKAYVLRSGSKISVTRMELLNEESLLIATGAGTYLVG